MPCAQLDVAGTGAWLHAALRAAPRRGEIEDFVPIAHGAAMALLAADGTVLAAPDYEDPVFETAPGYAAARDGFAATCSPLLGLGLNLGRQLFYLAWAAPALLARTAIVLPWPQYWAWWLSGVPSSELSSLGTHTDLWSPGAAGFSGFAARYGWDRRFAPLRRADAVLGVVRPELADAYGLPRGCRVRCGMHDSSASFHALRRFADTVIASGTWCIAMRPGVALACLQEGRDMLANMDIAGAPVGVARVMAGREYAAVAGPDAPPPDLAGLRAVLAADAAAYPNFCAAGGPFPGMRGRLERAAGLDGQGRAALATLYVALLADELLNMLGSAGRILLDGPLAANPLFAPALQTLRPADEILVAQARDGMVMAALALAGGASPHEKSPERALALRGFELAKYAASWRGYLAGA
ncbi:MAG: hypothetical protein B7Z80_05830 [Rhodospirillales bacterium 20-64-7]|nr:MAG: hypothetical protein B7Z80_05830 [Rhodospirillales bacterium 20-64-7]